MYVKKFVGDTLSETLNTIKKEFGPEAIILKTVTPKGIKKLSKSKIEITAAINEEEYKKKASVDAILNKEQKEKFYQTSAKNINETINTYNRSKQVERKENIQKGDLDTFLNEQQTLNNWQNFQTPNHEINVPQLFEQEVVNKSEEKVAEEIIEDENKVSVAELMEKIDLLEHKIKNLEKNIDRERMPYSEPLRKLIKLLRGIEIDDGFIQKISRKCIFELGDLDLENFDLVYDFALQEFGQNIHVSNPTLLNANESDESITILLSNGNSGQTSTFYKLANLNKNLVLISGSEENSVDSYKTTRYLMNKEISFAKENNEIMNLIRKAQEDSRPSLVDYKISSSSPFGRLKSFVEMLKKQFNKVEILLTISAINSLDYNKNMMNRYRTFADGLVITHLDLCSHYTQLFNLHHANPEIPLKLFSIGPNIPGDLEKANQERLLSKIFHF